MSRLDEIRQRHATRDVLGYRASPPAPRRAGDEIGRIRRAPGVGRDEAIAAAEGKPWWPRVRGRFPHATDKWWWWALRPEATP